MPAAAAEDQPPAPCAASSASPRPVQLCSTPCGSSVSTRVGCSACGALAASDADRYCGPLLLPPPPPPPPPAVLRPPSALAWADCRGSCPGAAMRGRRRAQLWPAAGSAAAEGAASAAASRRQLLPAGRRCEITSGGDQPLASYAGAAAWPPTALPSPPAAPLPLPGLVPLPPTPTPLPPVALTADDKGCGCKVAATAAPACAHLICSARPSLRWAGSGLLLPGGTCPAAAISWLVPAAFQQVINLPSFCLVEHIVLLDVQTICLLVPA